MKKLTILLIISFISLITFSMLLNPYNFFKNIVDILQIWLYKVYPGIFTFYIIASLLINTKLINKIIYMFRSILKHLRFNNENLLHLFILSVFIGNPSSTSLICQSIDRKEISTEEANDLLKCSSFLTPFYIISFLFVFGLKVAIIVLATHILSNFIIAFSLNCKNNKTKIKNSEIRFSFDDVLKSVNTVIYLLLMVSGTMVLAGILSYSITTFLDFFNIHSLFLKLILTNIEVSLGLNTLIEISLNEFTKTLLICFLISFGGLSLHLQVINIISDYHLKYLGFLKYRIIQGLISTIIFTIIYIIFIYLI